MRAPVIALLMLAGALCAGCGSEDASTACRRGSEPVRLDPADFGHNIDHSR
jgi:hypothetical protein